MAGGSESAIATVTLVQGALTTSGGYERFVETEGHRYSYLIDPRTGWPVEGLSSVSVAADQAIVAGSIASIALLQRPADGLHWLERCGAPYLAIDPKLRCYGHLLDHVVGQEKNAKSSVSLKGKRCAPAERSMPK